MSFRTLIVSTMAASVLAGTVGVLLSAAAPVAEAGHDGNCSHLAIQAVRTSCALGGIDRIKQRMKAAMTAANRRGAGLECTSCHTNLQNYALTDDAYRVFENLMAQHYKP